MFGIRTSRNRLPEVDNYRHDIGIAKQSTFPYYFSKFAVHKSKNFLATDDDI